MKGAKILQGKIGLESGDEGVNGVWIWIGYNNVVHINEKENQVFAKTINKREVSDLQPWKPRWRRRLLRREYQARGACLSP